MSYNIEGNKWANSACLSQRNGYMSICASVENRLYPYVLVLSRGQIPTYVCVLVENM